MKLRGGDILKNILFISYTNMFGGAEAVLCDYLKGNNINNNYIFTTNNKIVTAEYRKYILKEHIYMSKKMNIVSIREHPFIAIKNIIYNLYRINCIVKNKNINILYGNNTLDIVLLVLYKKYVNKNIKLISHVHDIIEKNYLKKFIEKYNEYVDQFIVPSVATKQSLIKCNVSSTKITVVYNGIDIDDEGWRVQNKNQIRKKCNIDKDKILLCFVGQICKRKRVDLFIDVINELNKENDKYIGIIIGKVSEEAYYNQIKKQIKNSIIYLGEIKRKDIFENVYPNIDILVLTSDRDPLPTVILEAMSQGVLVLARKVDGVCEIITNKVNGFVFSYEIDIDFIVRSIKEIDCLSNGEKNNIRNNAIRTIKEKFTLKEKQKIINKIIERL